MKRVVCLALLLFLLPALPAAAPAGSAGLTVSAKSAVLMEKETGAVLFEKNAEEQGFPASVTKIMTMLLIVEAMEDGVLSPDDIVTASERAASFGGSCVYLEAGEQMTVREMLKCIAVVSANDCAVAMAEQLCGSEEVFVRRMNERAQELGLKHTHFTNCTGLFDDGEHYTCAYDVALMSRELIGHESIKEYTTIWMDSIRGGDFELVNTNRLVNRYPGCTGLKTGYSSTARYCLSATAEKEGMELIAVILGAPSSADRFNGAKALLNYGFASYALVTTAPSEPLVPIPVTLGTQGTVMPAIEGDRQLLLPKEEAGTVTTTVDLPDEIPAPVKAGQALGHLTILVNGEKRSELPLVAGETVDRLSLWQVYRGLLITLFRG